MKECLEKDDNFYAHWRNLDPKVDSSHFLFMVMILFVWCFNVFAWPENDYDLLDYACIKFHFYFYTFCMYM